MKKEDIRKKKEKLCPYCGSDWTIKHGFKMTVKDGKKQRYFCNGCGRTFY